MIYNFNRINVKLKYFKYSINIKKFTFLNSFGSKAIPADFAVKNNVPYL